MRAASTLVTMPPVAVTLVPVARSVAVEALADHVPTGEPEHQRDRRQDQVVDGRDEHVRDHEADRDGHDRERREQRVGQQVDAELEGDQRDHGDAQHHQHREVAPELRRRPAEARDGLDDKRSQERQPDDAEPGELTEHAPLGGQVELDHGRSVEGEGGQVLLAVDLGEVLLVDAADDEVLQHEHVHLGAHEATQRVLGRADDRLAAHVEAGVDQHAA